MLSCFRVGPCWANPSVTMDLVLSQGWLLSEAAGTEAERKPPECVRPGAMARLRSSVMTLSSG